MTPPRTIMGTVMAWSWIRHPWRRRLIFLVLIIICGLFALFPRKYAAETELLPQASGGGLSAMLAQQAGGALLDLGSLTGNKTSVESDLTIARSNAVLDAVVSNLARQFPGRFKNREAGLLRVKHSLGIVAIRGSILQVTFNDRDPVFARAVVAAVAAEVQNRLADISVHEAAMKRTVAQDRYKQAAARLSQAQAALTQFRLANHLSAPEIQLGAGISLVANLQAQLQAREIELSGLEQVATSSNIKVTTLRTQIASLRQQIQQSQQAPQGPGAPTLAAISQIDTQYLNLYRNERTLNVLFQVYERYIEELTVDELSAQQNVDVIEPAFVLPERQFNVGGIGLLVIFALLAVLAEFYVAGPPVGRRAEAGAR